MQISVMSSKMVDFYQLLNLKILPDIWTGIASSNRWSKPLDYTDSIINASVDKTSDLRNLIGCLLDLLEKGYRLDIDFGFSSAG